MKNERFEMRAPAELLSRVDEWRREQPDIPNRSEAIRRLIEAGLEAAVDQQQKR
jgi:metal-responsive CopG/Arc/MetJ family transcriptional regulator